MCGCTMIIIMFFLWHIRMFSTLQLHYSFVVKITNVLVSLKYIKSMFLVLSQNLSVHHRAFIKRLTFLNKVSNLLSLSYSKYTELQNFLFVSIYIHSSTLFFNHTKLLLLLSFPGRFRTYLIKKYITISFIIKKGKIQNVQKRQCNGLSLSVNLIWKWDICDWVFLIIFSTWQLGETTVKSSKNQQ